MHMDGLSNHGYIKSMVKFFLHCLLPSLSLVVMDSIHYPAPTRESNSFKEPTNVTLTSLDCFTEILLTPLTDFSIPQWDGMMADEERNRNGASTFFCVIS